MLMEAYLSGDLDAESSRAFENRVVSDPDFKLAFENYKSTHQFLRQKLTNEEDTLAFKENLEKISSDYFDDEVLAKPKLRRIKPWYFSVAAGIIILFGIFIAQQFSSPTYDDFANYGTISLTVRGGQDDLKSKAEKHFNQKDYKDAERYFAELLQRDPEQTELQLYRAVCLVELNKYAKADALYQEIAKSPSVYADKAKWYLALSKLKQNEKTASISVLKSIPEDAEDYPNAQELLNKLE